jgi:parallel beta-helix repeat protein
VIFISKVSQPNIWNVTYIALFSTFALLLLVSVNASVATMAGPVVNLNTSQTYTTIQAAIDAANTGNTIQVNSGIYRENVVVNKTIKLVGNTSGTLPVIDGMNGTGINIISNNVTVRSFNVTNSSTAIYSNRNGIFILNNTITGDYYGIYLNVSNNCNVSGNTADNNRCGILLDNSSNYNTVTGNVANNNYNGIRINNTSNHNLVSGNTANNSTNLGIEFVDLSDYNTVSGNTAYNNSGGGILVWNSNYNILTENLAIANSMSGIVLYGSSCNNTVTGNRAINSKGDGMDVYYSSCNNTLAGNTITDNDIYGIMFYSLSNYNNFTGNTVSNNSEYGIVLYTSCSNNIVNGNTANNHTGYGGITLFTSCNDNNVMGNTANNNNIGIYLYDSCNNNTISWNTANNSTGSGIGFNAQSNNNTMEGNRACNNVYNNGIYLDSSNDNTLRANTANNNYDGIVISSSSGNTLVANSANENINNGIDLESSTNNDVSGNTANDNSNNNGINLVSSNDNILSGNTANNDHYGLNIYESNHNDITENSANNNGNYGVYVYASSYNNMTGNTANNTNGDGFYCNGMGGSNLTGNTADNNIGGIILDSSRYNDLTGNTVYNNTYMGIDLYDASDDNNLTGNTAEYNHYGNIWLEDTYNNTLTGNIACHGTNTGIMLTGLSYYNSITGNIVRENLEAGINISGPTDEVLHLDTGVNISGPSYNVLWLNVVQDNGKNANASDGSPNSWNSTSRGSYVYNGHVYTNYTGNYWGDYAGLDANGDGIGDSPYRIDANNVDRYPMLANAPMPELTANFTSNVTGGAAPLAVSFVDTSTGNPASWNWSFGDGTANATTKNAIHTFGTAGNYTVTLTVANGSLRSSKSAIIRATAATPNASYTGNSIPNTMVTTNVYNGSINFTNNGGTPWTSTKGDKLVLWGQLYAFNLNNDTSVNGYPAYSLPAGVTLNPGQTYTWNVSLIPLWSGSYGLGFQMVETGTNAWLGTANSKTIAVTAAAPNASYSGNTIPDTMVESNAYGVSVTYTNNGNSAWTSGKGDKLVMWGQLYAFNIGNDTTVNGYPAFSIPAGVTIQPGETYTWSFPLTPIWSGSYGLGFQAMQTSTNTWMGTYANKAMTVASAAPNAAYVNNSIPATMAHGTTYNAKVNFTNTGNTTWTSGKGDKLVFWGASSLGLNNDTAAYGYPAYSIPAGITVLPGQTYSWSIAMTPTSAGNYSAGFQVVQTSTATWMGNSGGKIITVS